MAQEYKIKAVKSQAKDWDGAYGPMKTYLIQLEGNGEPVQLNKKADSPVPQIGDELYGDIQETEYGLKFKGQKRPFGGSKFEPRADHHEEIKAQWAIGQAVQLYSLEAKEHQLGPHLNLIEDKAKEIFAMVDRVKESVVTDTKKTNKQLNIDPTDPDWHNEPHLDPDDPYDRDIAVNISDIPF